MTLTREELVSRIDSVKKLLKNAARGMGTGIDKDLLVEVSAPRELTDEELTLLYENSDMCAAVIDVPAELMTATWVNIELGEAEDNGAEIIEGLVDYETQTDTRSAFCKAAKWAFLYGRSYILIGANDKQPLDQPLDYSSIESVDFLAVLHKNQVHARVRTLSVQAPEIYDVTLSYNSLNADIPEEEYRSGSFFPVHRSRLLIFDGIDTPSNSFDFNATPKSKLQRFFWPFVHYVSAYEAVANMLTEYDIYIHAYENLAEIIASGGEDLLMEHMEDIQMLRSLYKMILIDKKYESGMFLNRDLSGVDKALERLEHRLATAADMPYLYFWKQVGRAGLGDSGDAERAVMQQKITINQERMFRKNLRTLYKIFFLAKNGPTKGIEPKRWSFSFNPIVILNPVQSSEIMHKDALRAKILTEIKAITPGEARSLCAGRHYTGDITLHSSVKPIFEYAENPKFSPEPNQNRDPEREYERKKENIELGKKENVDAAGRVVSLGAYRLAIHHEPGALLNGYPLAVPLGYAGDRPVLVGEYLDLDFAFQAKLKEEEADFPVVYGVGFPTREDFQAAVILSFGFDAIDRIEVIPLDKVFYE